MDRRLQLIRRGFWFFLALTIPLLLISMRYIKYIDDLDGLLAMFYVTIATVSHFMLLAIVPFVVLYIPVVLLFPHEWLAKLWSGIIASLIILVLLADTFVYDLYRFHINSFVLEMLFSSGGSQVFEFNGFYYAVLVILVLLLVALMTYVAHLVFKAEWSLKSGIKRWIVLSLVLSLVFVHLTHIWADASGKVSITKSSRYYPLFFPATGKSLMAKFGVTAPENEALESVGSENGYLNYPQQPLEFADSDAKTNIILILIDSWNVCTFDSVAMPNVYNFSKECEVYDYHYSGSNGTRTGLFSIFYGLPGIYWDAFLASRTSPILFDELLKRDYKIETYPSATLTNPAFDKTIFTNVKDITLTTEGATAFERDSVITFKWLADREKDKEKPLFSFLFYDMLHAISHPLWFKGPFQPAWDYAQYHKLNNEMDPAPFVNLYKNSANYLDGLIGKVLDNLRESGMLEKSWVIITGDHSQEFNENRKNFWGHNSNYSAAQMHIPFMIHKPGGKHVTYNHWTSHYDIVPTLMQDVLHCKSPLYEYSIGKNLTDVSDREWLIVGSHDNYGIIEPDRITSVNFNGSYTITDQQLNDIPGAKLNAPLANHIMQEMKRFYK